MEKKSIHATYIGDSKHYHLFHIDGGQGFMGTIYAPKEATMQESLSQHEASG